MSRLPVCSGTEAVKAFRKVGYETDHQTGSHIILRHPSQRRLSDGSSYEVPNHDAALVTRNWLEIGTDLGSDNIPGSVVRCAILHITQIEDLQVA